MFGLEAREDEGRRATEAALEVHHAVKNIVGPKKQLTLHSGIHAGVAFVEEGDEVRGRHPAFGEVTNVASRLSDRAGPDELLVSEVSVGTDLHFFEAGERRLLRLQGREEPLACYSIRARADVNTRFQARTIRGLSQLVGRGREMSLLRASYDTCVSGASASVWVVGPTGIGKTRLVEDFLRDLADRDCQILRGYCESYLRAEPLQPLLQILRQLLLVRTDWEKTDLRAALAAVDHALRQYADTLGVLLLPRRDDRRPAEGDIVRAIVAVLAARSATRPVVLFIDDVQWADDTTRGVLNAIEGLSRHAVLLISASREPAPFSAAGNSTTVDVGRLDAEHGKRLIGSIIPDADPFRLEAIQDASGGNPLFLEELAHTDATLPAITRERSRVRSDAEHVPNYLKMLIESRCAKLTRDQAAVVRAAAVVGNVVPVWLLETVASLRDKTGVISTLSDLDLVFPGEIDGTLRFKHGITRDVIADTVGLHERRALHASVARALEDRYPPSLRGEVLEALAYHYGGTTDFDQAAHYAEAAGDKAIARAALDRARLQYRAALAALERSGDEPDFYLRWASIVNRFAVACLYDVKREQLDVFHRALALATERHDKNGMAEAQYWLAYVHYALGEVVKASRHCERALEASERLGRPGFLAQVKATLAQTYSAKCDYDRALPIYGEAIQAQRPFKTEPRVASAFAYSLGTKALVLGDQGRFHEAHECLDEADEAVDGTGHQVEVSTASMRGVVSLWQGRWEAALANARKTIDVAGRIGSVYMIAMGLSIAGYARWNLDIEHGAEELERATRWLAANDAALWTSLQFGWATDIMVALGRFQDARHYAARALSRVRKGERVGEAMAFCALARMPEASHGRWPPNACFARAQSSAEARDSDRERAVIALNLAEFRASHGMREVAAELLRTCDAEFRRMEMRSFAARARHLERGLSAE